MRTRPACNRCGGKLDIVVEIDNDGSTDFYLGCNNLIGTTEGQTPDDEFWQRFDALPGDVVVALIKRDPELADDNKV